MLTEGKVRISTYRVYYRKGDDRFDEYVRVPTAQEAVDSVRKWGYYIEIIEVAKVVNNWK